MSISYHTYVGPYIHCVSLEKESPDPHAIPGVPMDTFNLIRRSNLIGCSHWLAPNQWRDGHTKRTMDFEAKEEEGLVFGEVDCAAEKEWMLQAYAAEIEALRAAYDLVTVAWGCVCYTI